MEENKIIHNISEGKTRPQWKENSSSNKTIEEKNIIHDFSKVSPSIECRSDWSEWSESAFAEEAKELHEFLDKQNVADRVYSPEGKLKDDNGTYYIIPLIDRVEEFGKTIIGALLSPEGKKIIEKVLTSHKKD